MASNKIEIIIQASDQATPAIAKVNSSLRKNSGEASKQVPLIKRLSDNWQTFAGISVASGIALRGLFGQMNRSFDAANKLQAALTGLSSVAKAFGSDADAAQEAARDLASDGLMTVADSATGLKNLLASGFSLPQAIQLMQRFKDSAAFGRQASLGFGEAIASATEGIKNGNSILVDNAGVTKNLSMMLTDAGFSAQDLSKATSNSSIRQAIFNGIIKETNAQVGDAAKLADSAAGKQAQMAAQTEVLYQNLGIALQPALLAFLQTVTPIIQRVSEWIQHNQGLASGIIIATGVLLTLSAAVGAFAPLIKTASVLVNVFGPTAVAAFGKAGVAFSVLKKLVSSRMIMGGIATGAALAAIALVAKAISDLQAQTKRTMNQIANTAGSITSNRASALKAYQSGKIDKESYQSIIQGLDNAARTNAQAKKDAQKYSQWWNPAAYFATGTNYAAGGTARVGEHGPEDIVVPRGSQVVPSYRTRRNAMGGGPTLVIENLNNYYPNDDQRLLRDIGFALETTS